MSAIPFLVYYPGEDVVGRKITRPHKISSLASSFIERGGRYRLAWHPGDMVEMVATMDGKGEDDLIFMARLVVPNDENLPAAVDQLVEESFETMGKDQ